MLFLMFIICQWGSDDNMEAKTLYAEPFRFLETRAESTHAYDVLKYELDAVVPMTGRSLQAVNKIHCQSRENGLSTAVLHSYTLSIDSVEVDDMTATFSVGGESLVVNLPQTYDIGDTFCIEVGYHGSWTVTYSQTGFVYYPKNYNSNTLHALAYMLGEPWDARRWMPCYDEPYDKADNGCIMKVTVPDTFVVCANGELTGVVTNPGGTKTFTWQEDYPIATYLMHFGVSRYAQWSDWYYSNAGDTVEIRHFMWPEDSAFSHTSFQYLPDAMYLFDSLYGPYPFDRYGQDVVYPYAWGGMEHQEMTTIHRSWLLNQSERGMAHELAHMWWGDMVTCVDFRDIWLNEGFATYSDANYIWYRFGHTDFINLMQTRAQTYFQEDASWRHPLYDPPVSELFNYGYTYCKASWVMHMLRYLDEEDYYPAIAVYRDSFDYGMASTEDLNAVFSAAYGTDLTWFFDEWVYGQGYPQYRVYWQCVPAGSDYQTTIVIHQAQSNAPIFHMPLEIMFDYSGPGDTLVRVDVLGSPQVFAITLADSVTSITVDPNVWLLKTAQVFVGVEDYAQDIPSSTLSFGANPALYPIVHLALPYQSSVELAVYDIAGRRVMQRTEGVLSAGTHSIGIGRLEPGVYFCVLRTEQEELTGKLVMID